MQPLTHGIFDHIKEADQPAPPTWPQDYIAFWEFENNTNDTTGTYDATAYGISYAAGKNGQCAVFAPNDYVVTGLLSEDIFLGNDPYTLAFWFKSSVPATYAFMLGVCEAGSGFSACVGATGGGGTGQVGFTRVSAVFTSADYCDGNWHFCFLSYDGSDIILNIDNVDNNTIADANTLSTAGSWSGNPLTFGRLGSYNGLYWDGCLDQFLVYDRCLTPTERGQLWNSGDGR